MAFVGDGIGVILANQGYLPMFVLAPMMWGLVPGIFLQKRFTAYKLAYVVPLTYLLASLSNTLALYIHFGMHTTIALLVLRVGLIPFNSVIIYMVVKDVHMKLLPFSERFNLQIQKT